MVNTGQRAQWQDRASKCVWWQLLATLQFQDSPSSPDSGTGSERLTLMPCEVPCPGVSKASRASFLSLAPEAKSLGNLLHPSHKTQRYQVWSDAKFFSNLSDRISDILPVEDLPCFRIHRFDYSFHKETIENELLERVHGL